MGSGASSEKKEPSANGSDTAAELKECADAVERLQKDTQILAHKIGRALSSGEVEADAGQPEKKAKDSGVTGNSAACEFNEHGDAKLEVTQGGANMTHLHRHVVSNTNDMKAPTEPTLVDNTLLFLPPRAAHHLHIEPNMDDKGDEVKEMWFGRVWELRQLMKVGYTQRMNKVLKAPLAEERKKELDAAIQDPEKRKSLCKVAAHWKGAAYRKHCDLSILEKLRWCNLRGVLVYAHGSGGCSWDNFRICRMIAKLGYLVIAPDGFAYPANTAMGQLRHKDLAPLKKAEDGVDYWEGDLLYSSSSQGSATYSTSAENVLLEPDKWRELYEKAYQLRRSELHFILGHLPTWVKAEGFFLGGTSEGGMTICRFDDQRYGAMVRGRFINSFSMEYCYFTPTEEAAKLGGQTDVPTLNIIGTSDQYFGSEDSVAKLVVEDEVTGYGDKDLSGHGFKTLTQQAVSVGLVCCLENGVHSPCNTHDNFLRPLFNSFLSQPRRIAELDKIWKYDDKFLGQLMEVKETSRVDGSFVTRVFVPTMKFPQRLPLARAIALREANTKNDVTMKELMEKEAQIISKERAEISDELEKVRKCTAKHGGQGFTNSSPAKENYYSKDRITHQC